jgi:hypothetical protein
MLSVACAIRAFSDVEVSMQNECLDLALLPCIFRHCSGALLRLGLRGEMLSVMLLVSRKWVVLSSITIDFELAVDGEADIIERGSSLYAFLESRLQQAFYSYLL